MKWNILRRFTAYGCDVRVFPATTPASDLLAMNPDGVFLSNGPEIRRRSDYAISNARNLVNVGRAGVRHLPGSSDPVAGDGRRYLQAEVRPPRGNHPVKELETGKVEITSQNHGFAVDPESLPSDVKVTHLNLCDGTVEGLRHTTKPVFCAAPSRSRTRAARRRLSLPAVRGEMEKRTVTLDDAACLGLREGEGCRPFFFVPTRSARGRDLVQRDCGCRSKLNAQTH